MKGLLRAAFLALLTTVLVSCGGGGGGGDTPPKPNTAPTATVSTAQTVLAGLTVQVSGTGADADGDTLSFAWTVSAKPDGSAVASSSLTTPTTDKTSFVPDVPGTYVLSLVVSDAKASSAPALVTITAQGAENLGISVDKPEPLSGATTLTLTGPTAGLQPTWYADLNLIGTAASVTWDTTTAANGTRQVMARIPLGGNRSVDVKRNVSVANASFTTLAANVHGTSGTIIVTVFAFSPIGTASVTASVDGATLGTLTAPNACFDCSPPPLRDYRFTVDGRALGSGAHTMKVVAVDSQGLSKELIVDLNVANTPLLTVDGPQDGSFVYDKLDVSGKVSSDRAGAVAVDVRLGDLSIIQGTSPAFAGSYDVSGLAPGTYKLTIKATDSTGVSSTVERQIVKVTSKAMALTPVMALGEGGRFLAAEGDRVLYRAPDKTVHLRDTAAGTDTVFKDGVVDVADVSSWLLAEGRVYTVVYQGPCAAYCLYQWETNQTVKNLSAGDSLDYSGDPRPVIRFGHVLWAVGSHHLALYNVANGTYTRITPNGSTAVSNGTIDMAMVGGVLNVFYGATTGEVPEAEDIYRWSANTGTSVNVFPSARRDVDPLSDGVRLAWLRSPLNPALPNLVSAPVNGGPITTLSTAQPLDLSFRDGVIAWQERLDNGRGPLKAATVSTTTTLSTAPEARIYGNEAGYVFYRSVGKTYGWNAQSNTSTLVAEFAPPEGEAWSTGRTLYFLSGSARQLFKVRAE